MTRKNDYARPPFVVGQRVRTHPGSNAWVRGDRYGAVHKVGRTLVHVRMDASGRVIVFPYINLEAC